MLLDQEYAVSGHVKDGEPGDKRWEYHYPELREALLGVAGDGNKINKRKLGWWLRKNAKRLVDGRCFIELGDNDEGKVWRLEQPPK